MLRIQRERVRRSTKIGGADIGVIVPARGQSRARISGRIPGHSCIGTVGKITQCDWQTSFSVFHLELNGQEAATVRCLRHARRRDDVIR